VVLTPTCVECEAAWLPADSERWLAYLDVGGELVFYCPRCAANEFEDD
jgi:hypothetical protein